MTGTHKRLELLKDAAVQAQVRVARVILIDSSNQVLQLAPLGATDYSACRVHGTGSRRRWPMSHHLTVAWACWGVRFVRTHVRALFLCVRLCVRVLVRVLCTLLRLCACARAHSWQLALKRIHGVGLKMARQLYASGITTVGELRAGDSLFSHEEL
jgi:hypothetical protein